MRVKTGVTRHRKHKKVLDSVKGARLSISKHIKPAKQALLHAGQYAFEGRKNRKRDMRRLWILRINAALAQVDQAPSYSVFMNLLKTNNVGLNRKMLSELAIKDPAAFQSVVQTVYGK